MAENEIPSQDINVIIVVGAMNPRIHHPYWYRTIGEINDDELKVTLAGSVVVNPEFSQFRLGSTQISISCVQGRWEIHCDAASGWERILRIASTVFTRLAETTITAFAFNSMRHLETTTPDVKRVLSGVLQEIKIGLPLGKSLGSNIQVTVIEEDFKVTTAIQPSMVSERSVFVLYNSEYQTPTFGAAESNYFDMGFLLGDRLPSFKTRSEKVVAEILTAVNERASRS